jgi:hypothetical protein
MTKPLLQYKSIEQFPQAHYEINVDWGYLESWLEDKNREKEETGFRGLELNPDFQRMHVWTPEQQSHYVEYILRGGESGRVLYWNHPNWMGSFKGYLTLVDGKQRMEAVRAFLRNEVEVFGGYRLKEMEPRFVGLGHADFRMRIAKLPTRKQMLQWYLMINAGGTPHTSDELDRVRALLAAEK